MQYSSGRDQEYAAVRSAGTLQEFPREHNYGISNNTVKSNIRFIVIRRNNWMFASMRRKSASQE